MKLLKAPVEQLLYITLAAVFIGNVLALGFLIFLVAQSSQQLDLLEARSKAANANTTKIIAQLKSQSDRQTSYIQCIADFFERPDRANLTLADLNSCTIMPSTINAAVTSVPVQTTPNTTSASKTIPAASPQAVAPKATATPAPSAAPAPSGQPGVVRSIINLVTGLLK